MTHLLVKRPCKVKASRQRRTLKLSYSGSVQVSAVIHIMRSSRVWMRSSRVVRASDSQCRSRNCPGFYPSILRHSGIWGAADEAVLNIVHKKKNPENPPFMVSAEGSRGDVGTSHRFPAQTHSLTPSRCLKINSSYMTALRIGPNPP